MSELLRFFVSDEARERGIAIQPPREADAGFDIPALEDLSLPAGEGTLIRTGIHLAIPLGWVGLVRDRSSIALRGGVTTAGVIDSSYRGELKILMHNLSRRSLELRSGERIAQLVVVRHLPGAACLAVGTLGELGETERGTEGFGSTGK